MKPDAGRAFAAAANALSLSRLFMAGALILFEGSLALWLGCIAGAAFTDVLDGPLARRARRLRGQSDDHRGIGEWLDPVCDKSFLVALLWSVCRAPNVELWWLVAIAARELIQVPAVAVFRVVVHLLRREASLDFRAGAPGKAATVAQAVAVMLIVLNQTAWIVPCVIFCAALGVYAAAYYVRRALAGSDPHADLLLHESPVRVVARRALTVPALLLGTLVSTALLPVLMPVLGLWDVLTRRRFALCRAALGTALNLWMHVIALPALLVLGLIGGLWPRRREELIFAFEVRWSRWVYRILEWLYGLSTEVEGLELLEQGPVVVMARHVSLIDPIFLDAVSAPSGVRLRHVAKSELLWDPAIDVLGHQVPMAFVQRGGRAPKADIEVVERMGEQLETNDGVLIFPEGTRYSEAKRVRILKSIETRHPEALAEVRKLRHVLPPHPAGSHALLAAHTDVVFCAHTGLEGTRVLSDLLGGALIDRIVRVKFWRVSARDVPDAAEARWGWLLDQWQRVDDWVEAHTTPSSSSSPHPSAA